VQASLRLFLSDRTDRHAGCERLSDVLNGPLAFVPAVDPNGKIVFFHKKSVMAVSVSAEEELSSEPSPEELASDQVSRAIVEVLLEDGSSFRGTIVYLMPEAQRRLQDFLNTSDRFLVLKERAVSHLINKARITRVSPL